MYCTHDNIIFEQFTLKPSHINQKAGKVLGFVCDDCGVVLGIDMSHKLIKYINTRLNGLEQRVSDLGRTVREKVKVEERPKLEEKPVSKKKAA